MSDYKGIKVLKCPGMFANCAITFKKTVVELKVSLNVKEDMLPYLPTTKVHKAKVMYVYSETITIRYRNMTDTVLLESKDKLMKRLQRNCKKAKALVLESQISKS